MGYALIFVFTGVATWVFWAIVFDRERRGGEEYIDNDGRERHGGVGYGGLK